MKWILIGFVVFLVLLIVGLWALLLAMRSSNKDMSRYLDELRELNAHIDHERRRHKEVLEGARGRPIPGSRLEVTSDGR
jgi:hypothetical protein